MKSPARVWNKKAVSSPLPRHCGRIGGSGGHSHLLVHCSILKEVEDLIFRIFFFQLGFDKL